MCYDSFIYPSRSSLLQLGTRRHHKVGKDKKKKRYKTYLIILHKSPFRSHPRAGAEFSHVAPRWSVKPPRYSEVLVAPVWAESRTSPQLVVWCHLTPLSYWQTLIKDYGSSGVLTKYLLLWRKDISKCEISIFSNKIPICLIIWYLI